MGLIDTHAHLSFPELASQVEEVLERCAQAGVEHVITVGTNLEDARKAVALAERYAGQVSAAVGFHPHEADRVSDEDVAAMVRMWGHSRVVAVGEMGLDYHYDFADRVRQREVFAGQLRAAAEVDKAVVIHCREAVEDTIAVLVEHGFSGRRVVFHCFTGTAEEAGRLAEHGWRISFTGIVTFPRSGELQEVARGYAADQMMVETDAPYLPPVPVRGKRPNEPAHVVHTARFLAELRGEEFEEFAARTTENARRFFGIREANAEW